MTNQVVTSSTDLETVIANGLTNGDSITINSGAYNNNINLPNIASDTYLLQAIKEDIELLDIVTTLIMSDLL